MASDQQKLVQRVAPRDVWRASAAEQAERTRADALPTDHQRQVAYGRLDAKVRARLGIPADRYYTTYRDGSIVIDETRRRDPDAVWPT